MRRHNKNPANDWVGPRQHLDGISDVPAAPPDLRVSSLNCATYLIRPIPYPNAEKPKSCISFVDWPDEDFARIRRLILQAASDKPSSFVSGEDRFPKDDAAGFFRAAGFSERDAGDLAGGRR
jgi:hypothetical protein